MPSKSLRLTGEAWLGVLALRCTLLMNLKLPSPSKSDFDLSAAAAALNFCILAEVTSSC